MSNSFFQNNQHQSKKSKFGENVTNYAPGASSPRKHRQVQRKEDFNNQNISSAGDFNFDQYNRKKVEGTHISGAEVRHLRDRQLCIASTVVSKLRKQDKTIFRLIFLRQRIKVAAECF